MKKVLFLILAGCFSSLLNAQELPQPSPMGKINQMVGLTAISMEYSRPSVKGRTIFGDLVPYGEVWRLGANACTKFTSSTDIEFGSSTLKAGTYAMFAKPMENGDWTIMFNTDTEQWGSYDYDEEKNSVTITVKAKANDFNETLSLNINNITNSSGVISIEWAKLRVDVPFSVKTDVFVKQNIDEAVKKGEELDLVYYRAASYAFKSLKDDKLAMSYLEQSFAVKKAHNSLFLKAQILKKSGKKAEAIQVAEEALKMAKAAEKKGWADYISENIEEWKK